MKGYVIAALKGGVGKSFLALNLAYGLAADGARTLLIDADEQGTATFGLGLPSSERAALAFRGEAVEPEKARDDLYVLSGGFELALLEERGAATSLRIPDNFDYVIVDCAPGLRRLTTLAITACGRIIVPTVLSGESLFGLFRFRSILENLDLHPSLSLVVPNMFESRERLQNEILERMRADFTLAPPIHKAAVVKKAYMHKQAVREFEPGSRAAAEISEVVELLKRN